MTKCYITQQCGRKHSFSVWIFQQTKASQVGRWMHSRSQCASSSVLRVPSVRSTRTSTGSANLPMDEFLLIGQQATHDRILGTQRCRGRCPCIAIQLQALHLPSCRIPVHQSANLATPAATQKVEEKKSRKACVGPASSIVVVLHLVT